LVPGSFKLGVILPTTSEAKRGYIERHYFSLLFFLGGFFGRGHTGQELEAAILASQEYFLHHGGTEMGFLAGVHQDVLHRPPDAPGALFWAQFSPATAVVGILASPEAYQAEVAGLYGQFLRRAPDPGGMSWFAATLQQGMPDELLVMALVGSDEYAEGAR
jgi:hypothetical protein